MHYDEDTIFGKLEIQFYHIHTDSNGMLYSRNRILRSISPVATVGNDDDLCGVSL